jgi:polysaccharide biosynthesis protein PslF
VRVCFVTGEYPPLHGGVGDYTAELARSLSEQGAESFVVTDRRGADIPSIDLAATSGGPPGRPIVRHWDWSCWRPILEEVRRERPDIVHVQYQTGAFQMHPAINLLPWRLRLTRNRPRLVVTYHDLKAPYLFPKAGPLRELPGWLIGAGNDAVVVTNEDDFGRTVESRRFSADLTGPPWPSKLAGRPLDVIPIGSNIPVRPDAGIPEWRLRHGLGEDDFVVGFFGFMNEWKGIDTLVEAIARLHASGRHAKLVLIGGTIGASDVVGNSFAGRVWTRVRELSLADSIVATGFLPPEEVSTGLRAVNVVALPFRSGACLRHGTLAAALVHGCPIVTTTPEVRIPSLDVPRVIDGENALLVSPGDVSGLALALLRLADDVSLRQRIGAGAARTGKHLQWSAIARAHLHLYARLLGTRPHLAAERTG